MSTRLAPVTMPANSVIKLTFNSFEKRRYFIWRVVDSIELQQSDETNAVTNRSIMYLDCRSKPRFDMFCLNGVHAHAVDIELTWWSKKITITFNSHREKLRLRAGLHDEFVELISELRSACPGILPRVVDLDVRSLTNRAVEDDGVDLQTVNHRIHNAGDVIHPRAAGPIDLFETTPYRLQPLMVPGRLIHDM